MRLLIPILLLAGCATAPGEQRAVFNATLNGLQVVPGPGDPDGIGTAVVRVNPGEGMICWELNVRQIDTATAASLRRGAAGSPGAAMLDLGVPNAQGQSRGCTQSDPALMRELVLRGHDFHLSVETGAFPGGAVRGQLRGGPTPRRTYRA